MAEHVLQARMQVWLEMVDLALDVRHLLAHGCPPMGTNAQPPRACAMTNTTKGIDPTDMRARNRRLDTLLASVDPILNTAIEKHIYDDGTWTGARAPAAIVTCFSGGNDSIVLAHLMRSRTDMYAHANTGIGIEATREFVRKTCAVWGVPLLERHPPHGSRYRDRVLAQGFPGPADHSRTFNRIKGRALEQVNAELVGNPFKSRVLFVAGRRFTESAARKQRKIPVWERSTSIKSMVWVSPLRGWTNLDLMTYRIRFPDCPRNPVADQLHASGECECGANAKRGELDYLRQFDFAADCVNEIEQLQHQVAAVAAERGIPAERCRWGWGAYRRAGREVEDAPGTLCADDCGLNKFATWDGEVQ